MADYDGTDIIDFEKFSKAATAQQKHLVPQKQK